MSAIAPARACAYRVVCRVFGEGAYADLALRSEGRELDARDRALAMRLSYGAIQRRGTLDHLIAQLAERPVERLDAPLLAALRLGLYELLYLEGAPDHAVVADAVELAKGGVGLAKGGVGLAKGGVGSRQGTAGSPQGTVGSRQGTVGSRQGGVGSRQGAARVSGRHVPTARRGGHGLVNAVLRRGAREGRALLEALDDETSQHAAIKHSHPEWIARMWWEDLGPVDARALMAFDNEPAELALRANALVSGAAQLAAELAAGGAQAGPRTAGPETERLGGRAAGAARTRFRGDPVIPEALVVEGPFDMYGSPQWRAGALIAQSRAAMLPARILGPRPGDRVLDLCAAPGGKTTHLAALMGDRGEVIAVERDPRRAEELRRTAQRLHAGCVGVVVADARQPLASEGVFDRVLVDPPCSGLGTLQARADLRWRATPERMRELTGVQRAILTSGAAVVRPGGVLVYSTCTISPAENERQIFDFLESHPRFVLDDLSDEPRLGTPDATYRLGTPTMDGRAVLTLPHRDRTAGFFIARLRREVE